MELRVLNYFLVVAKEENITRAAAALHITQPTLSRQLMQLEEELGVKLFTRGYHNIILTDEGMLLKRRAQEIVSLANKTKADFQQSSETLSGEIGIGSGEFYSSEILADMTTAFHHRYPLVQYQLYSGNADNIKERLENGILDIGLLSEPVGINKYDFIRIPLKEKFGILTRKDSPLAVKKVITPKDLINIPLIAPQRDLLQNEFANWMGSYREQLNVIMYGNLPYNQAMMVKSGLGAAIKVKLNCTYDDLVFIPLYPAMEFTSVIVWKKSQKTSPAVTEFIKFAKKYSLSIEDNLI